MNLTVHLSELSVEGVIDFSDKWTVRFIRSEEHTSELQSPVPISYAVFCLKKKKKTKKKVKQQSHI